MKTEDGKFIRVGAEKMRGGEELVEEGPRAGGREGCHRVSAAAGAAQRAQAARKAGCAFQAIHGGVPRGAPRERRIAAFQEANVPTVMVCQIAAAAEAIGLVGGGGDGVLVDA